MPIVDPKIGELNSVEQSQNPLSLDSEIDIIDILSKITKDATSPRVLSKMMGNYRGVVLKGTGDSTVVKTDSNWISRIIKGEFYKYRVRIPEIHSHYPKLDNYVDTKQTLACLYPEFLAEQESTAQAEPGSVVWCNYLDKENFLEPVYRGKVANISTIPFSTNSNNTTRSTILNGAPGQVATAGSSTDIINNDINDLDCPEPLNFVQCRDSQQSAEDNMYDIYVRGSVVGRKKMVYWSNKDGSQVLVSEEMLPNLLSMSQDLKTETGLDLKVNSGFRSYIQQKCMYDIYQECLKRWENSGRRGQEPSRVGNPDISGDSSHMTGKAIDFETNVSRNSISGLSFSQIKDILSSSNNPYSPLWTWLIKNSENYGFYWTGLNIKEPWHFELK